MTTTTKGIFALIETALMLVPEGDPLDYGDRDWTLADMIEIKDRLGSVRKAIDKVGVALAEKVAGSVPPGYSAMIDGGLVARISTTTRKPAWQDRTGHAFATWIKEQEPEAIAAMLSSVERETGTRRPRLAGLTDEVKDTFLRWESEDTTHPTMTVAPVEQIKAKWIQAIRPGDIARWDPDTRSVEYLERVPEAFQVIAEGTYDGETDTLTIETPDDEAQF